ncbi:unnamed protein product [Effrenium voratum]|nr:unnamed protein product [Effrenium voratum]
MRDGPPGRPLGGHCTAPLSGCELAAAQGRQRGIAFGSRVRAHGGGEEAVGIQGGPGAAQRLRHVPLRAGGARQRCGEALGAGHAGPQLRRPRGAARLWRFVVPEERHGGQPGEAEICQVDISDHGQGDLAPGDATLGGGATLCHASRFQVLAEAESADSDQDAKADSEGRGRKSARRSVATGAWSEPQQEVGREFVYYTERQTWQEDADIDSRRLQARWQSRDKARWEEQSRQAKIREEERLMSERLRKEAFGEVETDEPEDEDDESLSEGEDAIQPLPQKARVVPIILKTKSVSQFDMLMDEIERVQEAYGMRIVIVHGGLGPVIPKDVVHAEVEKRYGYCPIYAFQVGVNSPAQGQAEAEQIDIRRFDVFTDLLGDLMERCGRIEQKVGGRRSNARRWPFPVAVWLRSFSCPCQQRSSLVT